MAKANRTWTVHPHGPLEPVADGLWAVVGSLPGMSLPRRMTVVRLDDGSLLVHNAVALDEATMAELDALGPVSVIVVPSGYHRLDAPAFAARYPKARVLCPRGSRKKVELVVRVDGTYDDLGDDANVRLVHLAGTGDAEGVLEVRSPDGVTLVFNDVVFNLPHMPGLFWLIYGRLLGATGGPRITLIARMFVLKDRRAFAAELEGLARTPDLRRVLVSHGAPIVERARETLAGLAGRLR